MLRTLVLLLFPLVLMVFGGPVNACSKPKYSGAFLKQIPTKGINQSLFSEALRREVNYVRCRANRGELAAAEPLTKIAAGHSTWMARAEMLSHTSTVPGKSRVARRVKSTGIKYRTAAENIAAYNRFAFPKGQFKIRNASACKFATQSGKAIPAHSYASLAAAVVGGWMKSSGHKKNLLNRRMKLAGGGLAFDGKAPYCGRFFVTQNYLG